MSTLMKIEPFVLETSISDIFFNGVLTKVHREKNETSYMFLLEGAAELELFPELTKRDRIGLDVN